MEGRVYKASDKLRAESEEISQRIAGCEGESEILTRLIEFGREKGLACGEETQAELRMLSRFVNARNQNNSRGKRYER